MFSKKLMSGDNIIPFVNGMENCWKMRGPMVGFPSPYPLVMTNIWLLKITING
jgi:hypothetical protein